jgi:hypothetical protein
METGGKGYLDMELAKGSDPGVALPQRSVPLNSSTSGMSSGSSVGGIVGSVTGVVGSGVDVADGDDVVDNDDGVLSEKSGVAGGLCSSFPMCDVCGLWVTGWSGMDACPRRSARLSRVRVCWSVIGLVLGAACERVSLIRLVDARAEYRVRPNHQNENRRPEITQMGDERKKKM